MKERIDAVKLLVELMDELAASSNAKLDILGRERYSSRDGFYAELKGLMTQKEAHTSYSVRLIENDDETEQPLYIGTLEFNVGRHVDTIDFVYDGEELTALDSDDVLRVGVRMRQEGPLTSISVIEGDPKSKGTPVTYGHDGTDYGGQYGNPESLDSLFNGARAAIRRHFERVSK